MEQEKVWDKIVSPWQNFRQKQILESLEFVTGKKGKILDLGCGAGRNFVKSKDLEFYGIDFSKKMLELAKKYANKIYSLRDGKIEYIHKKISNKWIKKQVS